MQRPGRDAAQGVVETNCQGSCDSDTSALRSRKQQLMSRLHCMTGAADVCRSCQAKRIPQNNACHRQYSWSVALYAACTRVWPTLQYDIKASCSAVLGGKAPNCACIPKPMPCMPSMATPQVHLSHMRT
jgi:hypothetical protein